MLGLMRTLAQERPRQEMHDVDIDMYAPSDVSAQGLATPLMDLELPSAEHLASVSLAAR